MKNQTTMLRGSPSLETPGCWDLCASLLEDLWLLPVRYRPHKRNWWSKRCSSSLPKERRDDLLLVGRSTADHVSILIRIASPNCVSPRLSVLDGLWVNVITPSESESSARSCWYEDVEEKDGSVRNVLLMFQESYYAYWCEPRNVANGGWLSIAPYTETFIRSAHRILGNILVSWYYVQFIVIYLDFGPVDINYKQAWLFTHTNVG